MDPLEEQILAAHAAGDRHALARLYTDAADRVAGQEAEGFFLTHAYIFALEAGAAQAPALRARLVELGREAPDHTIR